jgi:hypoxanthine phosphoribosyltransferase
MVFKTIPFNHSGTLPKNDILITMKLNFSDVENLINQIDLKSPDFDFVVGISRGGLIPAALLAIKLNKPLATVYIDKQNNVYLDRKDWILGKKVLLIDDICRTGTTLKTMKHFLKKNEVADIKTLTLYCLSQSRFQPDIVVSESNENVSFPWD